MKEFDKKTLETAIIYVKRLAEGNNPINNQPMEEDTVLNNPNVIRCMYFVREVLEEVYNNNGATKKKAEKTASAIETFPREVLSQYSYREDKSIQNIISQIYEPVRSKGLKMLSGKVINDRLMANGYITEVYSEEFNKNVKVPTEKGIKVGMRAERVEYPGRTFISIFYNKEGQEFLIANFLKLLDGEAIV